MLEVEPAGQRGLMITEVAKMFLRPKNLRRRYLLRDRVMVITKHE